VNNAAVFPRTPLDELTPESLGAVLRTNLEAPLFLTQACAPMLRARRGAVVNIADIYGTFPLRHHLAYSVSKAALIAATRSLAVEVAPEVRVNAVAPGIAIFPDGYDEAARQRLLAKTLLRREGGAAEIARAVRFLIEGADTVTGQVLTVDGGRTLAL
jgi:pteridine reductase